MILQVMDQMMTFLGANVGLAILGAFLWGVASVALSPCHLFSIPLVMAFVAEGSKGAQKRAFLLSLTFALGSLLAILLLGLSTAAMGRILGDLGSGGLWLGIALFLLMGAFLLEWISLPQMALEQRRFRGGRFKAALILGLLFGVILGPCAFAFLMPVLGLVLSKANSELYFSVALLFAYSLGHGTVLVVAGSASAWTFRLFQSPCLAPWLSRVRKALGLLCFVIAVLFLLKALA
ncbi:MAG TPA: cytochrome c biogenesis protein CcdA [Fibrobacteraceae bacterium]|nr:cytochrome c biogenesis protein CcdA [Fibrobacteraceae bacterium]